MPSTESFKALCISIHDVAPHTWSKCSELLRVTDALGVTRVTLLVVPDYHKHGIISADTAFVRAVEKRIERGDEVALHGYYHIDDTPRNANLFNLVKRNIYTASEGEFAALSMQEASARIEKGLEIMESLGWPISGFVAPAWLLSKEAKRALNNFPLLYTTTRTNIIHLPSLRSTLAPSLVYSTRAAWRRTMSVYYNRWLFNKTKSDDLLRISLHPADALYSNVMTAWERFIQNALITRTPLTKTEWVNVGIN